MKIPSATLLTICLAAILPCSGEEPKATGKLVTVEDEATTARRGYSPR